MLNIIDLHVPKSRIAPKETKMDDDGRNLTLHNLFRYKGNPEDDLTVE